MKRLILILFCLTASFEAQAQKEALSLTVTIEGAGPNSGQIFFSLFDSKETWMEAPAVRQTAPVDENGRCVFITPGLPAGEYAASVFYDENMNGELDTGFLGIPKEKFGFSNNAKARMGPASYKDAKFLLDASNTAININLAKAK